MWSKVFWLGIIACIIYGMHALLFESKKTERYPPYLITDKQQCDTSVTATSPNTDWYYFANKSDNVSLSRAYNAKADITVAASYKHQYTLKPISIKKYSGVVEEARTYNHQHKILLRAKHGADFDDSSRLTSLRSSLENGRPLSVEEIKLLLEARCRYPAVNLSYMTNVHSGYYWTITDDFSQIWKVNLATGEFVKPSGDDDVAYLPLGSTGYDKALRERLSGSVKLTVTSGREVITDGQVVQVLNGLKVEYNDKRQSNF